MWRLMFVDSASKLVEDRFEGDIEVAAAELKRRLLQHGAPLGQVVDAHGRVQRNVPGAISTI